MLPPLHFSQMKNIAQSPAHYLYFRDNPQPQTKAMRIGSALDMVARSDDFDPAAVAKMVKTEAEARVVCAMAKSLMKHRDAWSLLRSGITQQTIKWKMSGRECEGTPDSFTPTRVVDLKTTRCGRPERFIRDATWRAYHAQVHWYATGLRGCGLADPKEYLLVTVENVAPWLVTVFELQDGAIEAGERTWRGWFEQVRVCEESAEWPGYAIGRVPFDCDASEGMTLRIGGEEVEVE